MMTTDQKVNSRTKTWAIAGLVISWATFWMFLLSPFGFIAWIAILVYLIVKKSFLKWYVVFSAWLIVPGCSFLTGSARYLTGTASLQGVGGPETYHGLDRETRVAATSSGCIFVGYEPFVFPANNAAVRLWTNVFGFQKDAYAGQFPTEEEARELMKRAAITKVKQQAGFYKFRTAGLTIKLDTVDLYRYNYDGKALIKVAGKMLGSECFLFKRLDSVASDDNAIYIVDIGKNKLLTRYLDSY